MDFFPSVRLLQFLQFYYAFLLPEFDRQLQWSSSAFTLRPKRHQATLLGLLQNSPTHHGYSSSRCYFPAAGTHGYTQTRVQPGQSSFFRVRKKNFLLLLRKTNKNEIKFSVCDKKKVRPYYIFPGERIFGGCSFCYYVCVFWPNCLYVRLRPE